MDRKRERHELQIESREREDKTGQRVEDGEGIRKREERGEEREERKCQKYYLQLI